MKPSGHTLPFLLASLFAIFAIFSISAHGQTNIAADWAQGSSGLTGGNSTPLNFFPITPCRSYDTRTTTAIQGGTSRSFVIPGTCGVPTTAAAYSFNVAVVPHGSLKYLTVWPTGQDQPVVATLNSIDGRTKSNAAIVPAGTGGAISVYASMASTQSTDVILDINGYFVPTAIDTSGLEFYPLTPCRVVDTRNANGPLGGPSLVAKQTRDFPILQNTACGIPPTAQAYSLNFAAIPQGPLGYLTAWPADKAMPVVATLNAPTGTVTANAALVPSAQKTSQTVAIGDINVYATANTGLVIDIDGYFAPANSGGQSLFGVTPCRVIDTRQTIGLFTGKIAPLVNVTTSPCGIPATAGAFVLNATVVPQGHLGYLTLWPDPETQPLAATLNALDGAVTNNMAIVPSVNGSVDAYAAGYTNLILDISSYFAPTAYLSISSTLPIGVVGSSYAGIFVASGGTPPYGYSVTQGNFPPGLSLDATSGLVSGTPMTAGDYSFTVQAEDSQSLTAVENANIAINSNQNFVVKTKALPVGSQNANYSGTLVATGGAAPYTWTIVSGALPPGLALDPSTGLISGVPTATGTFTFVVQAKDSTSQYAFAVLDILVNSGVSNGLLSGNYAFSFSGFDGNQQASLTAGSIVADGGGRIISGVIDTNSATNGVGSDIALTGAYSIDSNGLGVMSITAGSDTADFSVSVSTNGAVHFIQLLRADHTGGTGTGVLQQQTKADFSLASLAGPFALGLTGSDSTGNRFGYVGTFQLDNAGNISGGSADFNDNGAVGSDMFTGTLSAVDPNTGRGTMTVQSSSTRKFAFYVLDRDDILLVSADTLSLTTPADVGSALARSTTSFNNSSLNGNSVLEAEGIVQVNQVTESSGVAGLLTANGSGTASVALDMSSGGNLSQQTFSGTYNVATNGRATLTGFGPTPPILYLVDVNRGFLLGTDNSVTLGSFRPQLGSSFSNASFNGIYLGSSGQQIVPGSNYTILSSANGSGNVAFRINTDGNQTQIVSGTYAVETTGRVVISTNGSQLGVAYVVSNGRIQMLVPGLTGPVFSLIQ